MEALPGFVFIPRVAGSPRPPGGFFSATVVRAAEPGTWVLRLGAQTLTVTSDLPLAPGQTLRLKLVSQEAGRWRLQLVGPGPGRPEVPGRALDPSALASAFLSRGLPLAADRLGAWTRWLAGRAPGPTDRDAWAASAEARGWSPTHLEPLEPWLAWQAALEAGRSEPPPGPEEDWDAWNLRRPPAGDPWLVCPLTWEFEGRSDSGLLQAHWSPPAQAIDRWNLTAAPAGVPCRIEAQASARRLDLTWRFFRPADLGLWAPAAEAWGPRLSTPDLAVTLRVRGPEGPPLGPREGVDVQA